MSEKTQCKCEFPSYSSHEETCPRYQAESSFNTTEPQSSRSLDPLVKSTAECLTKLDDILHSIQSKAQYLSYADQNGTLKESPERIAHEMNQIDTMLNKARVLLFQAHKSPVMLACITELLNQERTWSLGGCHKNLTKGIMAAVTSPPSI